jgi:hypothetical protein
MRCRFFAYALVISVMLTTVASAQTGGWTKFSSTEGRFSVLMPLEPVRSEEVKETPVGKVSMHFFTTRGEAGIFIVAYADYAISDPKRELDANRNSFLKGMKATLISESDIKLEDNPGRDIRAVRDALSIRSRIYLVGKRYYQVVALTPATLPGNVEADRFLSSFELAKSVATAPQRAAEASE